MNPLKKCLHLHLFLSLYIFLAFLKVKYVQADAAPETMKEKKILPNDTTKGLRGRRKLIDEETDPNALDEVVNKINSREQGNVTTGNAGETRDVTTEDAGETHNVTTGIERQQIRATFTTMRGACRVRSWSRGDEGRDYDEYYGWSYDKCKRKCQERDYCKGFEHDDAGDNRDCEIWYTRPTKAEKKKNYVCEYKDEDSSDSEESSESDGSSDSEESSDPDESTDSDESSDPDESTDSDESSDLDEGSDSDESSDLDESSSDGDTEKNNETNDEEKIDSDQGNNGNDGELSNNNEKSIKIDEVNVYENENKKSSTEQSNESTDYW